MKPANHFTEAERLLAEVDEVGTECLHLAYVRSKLALAQVHALLAQCPPEFGVERRGYRAPREVTEVVVKGAVL